MHSITLTMLMAVTMGGPMPQQEFVSPAPTGTPTIQHCQVFLIQDVEVPAEQAGRLVRVDVREDDMVEPGDLLAQIDDRQAQLQKTAAELERNAAQTRADDDIEVRFSIKSFELADAELNQDLDINRQSPGVIPMSEIRRKQLARHRAELQIDRSKLDLRVAQMTADVQQATVLAAEENILRCQINAPFKGVVIDVLKQEGQWVDIGEPVIRVVRMDRLRVDGFLDGKEFNPSDLSDRQVVVKVQLARGQMEQFTGKVTFISPLVQAGNQYRIRAEVENRQRRGHWLLRPGMNATMTVHGN
ncbi:MAG TPA: HlyD family efflux transporter periplasmic adaptor subunit [Pirellulaceae bacterium]|nr:HlyD family efflux transporter periplasmic adaptor subunit [Pirellulaceae bacterium]